MAGTAGRRAHRKRSRSTRDCSPRGPSGATPTSPSPTRHCATSSSPPPGPRAGRTASPSASSSSPTGRWRPEAKRLIGEGARRFWAAKREADGYDTGSGAAGRLAQGAHGPHHAALRRHLRVGARARAGLLPALPARRRLHRRCIGLPRLPEPAAGRPGPRLRRRHDGLAVRGRRRAAGAAAHPRRGRDHGDHHPRAARRAATGRCAAGRCPSWSTGSAGARPPPGRSTRPGAAHTSAGPPTRSQ